MKIFATIMRYFAYLFHFVLALLIAGVSAVALLSGFADLRVGSLPFPKESLPAWLLGLALVGLICVLLAFRGKVRGLFTVYAVAVFGLLLYGYFLSRYYFAGPEEATRAACITIGAGLSLVGAVLQFRGTGKRA